MKTKELIRQLQDADPSGELECCVENIDIHFVEREAAYYDGALQVLTRDENEKYYNITGGKYKRTGNKITIHTLSIQDVVAEDPDGAIIDYSELSEESAIRTKKAHDNLREYVRIMENNLELEYFLAWVKTHAEKLTADMEDVKRAGTQFFDKNVSRKDPLPKDGIPLGQNYIETRKKQWDNLYEVHVDEGFLEIRKK